MTTWEVAEANKISNTTKVIQTDDKLQATLDDIEKWINSTDAYTTDGIKYTIDEFLIQAEADIAGYVDDSIVVEW